MGSWRALRGGTSSTSQALRESSKEKTSNFISSYEHYFFLIFPIFPPLFQLLTFIWLHQRRFHILTPVQKQRFCSEASQPRPHSQCVPRLNQGTTFLLVCSISFIFLIYSFSKGSVSCRNVLKCFIEI